MNYYNAIAGVYDTINSGVDYSVWGDYVESLFDRYMKARPELVLDLACGTGRMTLELAARGYDMIGVDLSEEMLAEASNAMYEKIDGGTLSAEKKLPLFLCQEMSGFELYGTVGAALCCLDSLNYLTEKGELLKTFKTVHNYLDPDGLFIFDMNTPYKFENVYGENTYVYELDGADGSGKSFCVWQNFYDAESRLCDFFLTLFEEQSDGRYARKDEEQCERCYSFDEIKRALEESGFELLLVGDGYDAQGREKCSATSAELLPEKTERWYFAARCVKEG